jgi:hypothetical protein
LQHHRTIAGTTDIADADTQIQQTLFTDKVNNVVGFRFNTDFDLVVMNAHCLVLGTNYTNVVTAWFSTLLTMGVILNYTFTCHVDVQ